MADEENIIELEPAEATETDKPEELPGEVVELAPAPALAWEERRPALLWRSQTEVIPVEVTVADYQRLQADYGADAVQLLQD